MIGYRIEKPHSRLTLSLLILLLTSIGTIEYLGESVSCDVVSTGPYNLNKSQIGDHCRKEEPSLFTGHDGFKRAFIASKNLAYLGPNEFVPLERKFRFQSSTEWVFIMLFLQCILFTLPKLIWTDKRMIDFIEEIKVKERRFHQYKGSKRYRTLAGTFTNILVGGPYFRSMLYPELYTLTHLIIEIYCINVLLSGKFLLLGFQWIFYHNFTMGPLIEMFPRITQCSLFIDDFRFFGIYNTFCFFPVNYCYEMIFIVLWFWFPALLIFTLHHLFINRLAIALLSRYRLQILKTAASSSSTDKALLIKTSQTVSQFFVIYAMAKDVEPQFFQDLLEAMRQDYFDENFQLKDDIVMPYLEEEEMIHQESAC